MLGDESVAGDIVLVDSYRVRADDRTRVRADLVDRDRRRRARPRGRPRHRSRSRRRRAACTRPRPRSWPARRTRSSIPTLRARPHAPIREAVQRVLVTTGGADSDGRRRAGRERASPTCCPASRSASSSVRGAWARDDDRDRRGARARRARPGARRGRPRGDRRRRHDARGVLPRPARRRVLDRRPGQGRALAGAAHVGAVVAVDVGSAAESRRGSRTTSNARSRLVDVGARAGRRSGFGARRRGHRGHGPPRRPRPLTGEHEPARLVGADLEQRVEHREVRHERCRRGAARTAAARSPGTRPRRRRRGTARLRPCTRTSRAPRGRCPRPCGAGDRAPVPSAARSSRSPTRGATRVRSRGDRRRAG